MTVPPSEHSTRRGRSAKDSVSDREDTGSAARTALCPVRQSRELPRSLCMARMTKSACRSKGHQTPLKLTVSCLALNQMSAAPAGARLSLIEGTCVNVPVWYHSE